MSVVSRIYLRFACRLVGCNEYALYLSNLIGLCDVIDVCDLIDFWMSIFILKHKRLTFSHFLSSRSYFFLLLSLSLSPFLFLSCIKRISLLLHKKRKEKNYEEKRRRAKQASEERKKILSVLLEKRKANGVANEHLQ